MRCISSGLKITNVKLLNMPFNCFVIIIALLLFLDKGEIAMSNQSSLHYLVYKKSLSCFGFISLIVKNLNLIYYIC